MRVAVLGPLAIDGDASGTAPRDRVVLEALAVEASRSLTTDQIADALWSDEPPASSTKVVQGCVSRLRSRLGSTAIETTADGYRLNLSATDVDSARFEQLADRGRELLSVGQPERATHVLQQALALWRGRPFHDLDEWEIARIERRRLEELLCEVEELAVEARLRAGDHSNVIPIARSNAEREPLREPRWSQLARAQYQAGSQTDALRTIGMARTVLREQAGLDPSAELLALETAILRHDPGLDVRAASTAAEVCPYPGLVAFGVDDSELFFGREEVVANCLEVLERERVVVVVGPSGCGKSSVVRAGIAAAWRHSGRTAQVLTPGTASDSDVHQHVADLLVVDQIEEAVTIPDGTAMLDSVTDAADQAMIVLALRADRLGEVSAHAGVARLVERGLVLLPPLSDEQLRRAIEEPARAAGLLLEAGLVDLLIREVESEPGALPLLSHALRATWERREGRVLTVTGYRESGGLRGAVAQTAERLYRGLGDPQRMVVRELMLRMLVPTLEGDAVRSPVPRRLVASDDERERLVELLVDARLVTSDGDTVELAHEALVRGWPRLRNWLDDDVDGQRILRHLTLAADGWYSMGRPDTELYRGQRLAGALAWRDRAAANLTPIETDFLAASERVADAEHDDLASRARVQARHNRRLRAALTAVAILFVAAVVAGSAAVRSADRARSEADSAEQNASASLVGLSHRVAEQDRGLALLLAIEAHRTAPSTSTRAAMLGALVDAPLRRTSVLTPADDHYSVAIDPAGNVAAAKRPDGSLDIVDLVDRHVRHVALPGAPTLFGGIAVDPAGRFVASGGLGDVVVYDLVTAASVASIRGGGGVELPAFSPDGDMLAIAREAGSVALYDVASWTLRRTIDVGSPLSALTFDDTGTRLFVTTVPPTTAPGSTTTIRDAELIGLDVETGDIDVGPVNTHEQFISSVVTWPGRGELAVAGWQISRFDVNDLTPIGEPFGRAEVDLVSLAISPDGLLFAGSPVELQVHDLTAEGGPQRIKMSLLGSPGVAVTADGAELVTADIDGALSTWTLQPKHDLGSELGPDLAGQVTLSMDGTVIVVWETGPAVVLDVDQPGRRTELRLTDDTRILGVDVDRTSERIVTLSCPPDPNRCVANLDVWDRTSGQRLAGPRTIGDVWPGLRRGVAYARDDRSLVVPLLNGAVGSWDAQTLEPEPGRLDLAEHTALAGVSAWGVDAADVDGRSLVVAQDELGQSVSWDVTNQPAKLLGALENAFRMQYLPDGRLITATAPGALVIRDPFTLHPVVDVLPGTMPADTYSVSTEGVLVASGDHGVQMFDLAVGTLLTPTALPSARSAISPDGSQLYLSTDPDGAVRAVSLIDDELTAAACRQAGRNLSIDEWRRLVGPETDYRPTCRNWPSATGQDD